MKTVTHSHPAKPFSARKVLRVLAVTGALLLVPAISTLSGGEFGWGVFDFAAAAVLLAGAGLAFELAMAKMRTRSSRLVAGAAIALALLTIWAELAVGILH